jgi:Tol biopolymer transport system component
MSATSETGEPNHAGHATGASVWYSWQAPASGNVTFDTSGGNLDTVLGVYTGSSVSALTQVASNDDMGAYTYSVVTFNATANTVYYIAVDVYDLTTYPGTIKLNWQSGSPSPAPTPAASNRIAFSSFRGLATGVYAMNDDGSAQVHLSDKDLYYCGVPVWSPDGSRLAYATDRDGQMEIYVMDADGSDQTRLTTSAGSYDAAWSPVADQVAFSSYDSQGNENVYVINADGTGLTNVSNDSTGNSYWPVWSPDGTKLLFLSARNGDWSVYVVDADGTDLAQLTTTEDDLPVWSPDGTRIAFVTWRDGNGEIYVMDADGTNETNLTNTHGFSSPPFNYCPSWSPDGTQIAFSSNRSGHQEVYVMDDDGSNQTRLTTSAESDDPLWSPDGTKIAFTTSRDGNREIYLMDPDGTDQVNLTHSTGFDGRFSWQQPAP